MGARKAEESKRGAGILIEDEPHLPIGRLLIEGMLSRLWELNQYPKDKARFGEKLNGVARQRRGHPKNRSLFSSDV